MRNPFRSEADAFRTVWVTVGCAVLVVIGAVINRWVGLAVAVVLVGLATAWLFGRGKPEQPVRQKPAASPEGEHRILVVANETVGGQELLAELQGLAGSSASRILVVCPALNSPLRHWASDEDGARGAAHERLDASMRSMREAGLDVSGEVGDGDPLQAIEDAVRTFRPDALVISTHPAGRSHWLEQGLVDKARQQFDLPVTHVVVDLGS